eukprot:6492384-Amphidinium_carterae.3
MMLSLDCEGSSVSQSGALGEMNFQEDVDETDTIRLGKAIQMNKEHAHTHTHTRGPNLGSIRICGWLPRVANNYDVNGSSRKTAELCYTLVVAIDRELQRMIAFTHDMCRRTQRGHGYIARLVSHPSSTRRVVWDVIGGGMILYDCVIIPLRVREHGAHFQLLDPLMLLAFAPPHRVPEMPLLA